MTDEERDWFHLRQILRFVAHIERRLSRIDEATFHADRDEIDLAAYRFQMIGEGVRRLSASLKSRHPDILSAGIIGMRNIIAHDYEGIASSIMWNAARDDFPALSKACQDELAQMGENEPDG